MHRQTENAAMGDTVVIAPGTPHGFRDPLPCETRFVATATPGAGFERLPRTIHALANRGAA